MSNLKRLAQKDDKLVVVESPVTPEVLLDRQKNYPLLSPVAFGKKYREVLYQPVTLKINGVDHQIQVNFCVNPFCKWFGLPQYRFQNAKNAPYRYKISGSERKKLYCNPDPLNRAGAVGNDKIDTFSNWSLADEIARLVTNDKVVDREPEYNFHHVNCPNSDSNPLQTPQSFYRRGKSTANSQRWQCRECQKITNILPSQRESFSYHQQRNDVLVDFARAVLNRVPVKRTCEQLQIGSSTYYNKLEWLYRRCLEFLERHETKALSKKSFDELWVNTDKLSYYLNNVRKKGSGGTHYDDTEEKIFQTFIVASADLRTRYVFRADLAYDWQISLADIEKDTLLFKEDHLYSFARKYDRLRFSFYPQPPAGAGRYSNSNRIQYSPS